MEKCVFVGVCACNKYKRYPYTAHTPKPNKQTFKGGGAFYHCSSTAFITAKRLPIDSDRLKMQITRVIPLHQLIKEIARQLNDN